jgi:hypothetical protein
MSDKFCFYHGTHYENLPFILKNKVIKMSSEVEDKHDVRKDWGGGDYIYGGIFFNNDIFKYGEMPMFDSLIIVDQKILDSQLLIFNPWWVGRPMQDEQTSNDTLHRTKKIISNMKKNKKYSMTVDNQFSIYLNKFDSSELMQKKLHMISEYVNIDPKFYVTEQEILFTKPIRIDKYARSIITFVDVGDDKIKRKIYRFIKKIMDKKYKQIKYFSRGFIKNYEVNTFI